MNRIVVLMALAVGYAQTTFMRWYERRILEKLNRLQAGLAESVINMGYRSHCLEEVVASSASDSCRGRFNRQLSSPDA